MSSVNMSWFTTVTLPPHIKKQVLELFPVGSLVDQAPVHRIRAVVKNGERDENGMPVLIGHELLVAGGSNVMEVDGKQASYFGEVHAIQALQDPPTGADAEIEARLNAGQQTQLAKYSRHYGDYDRLLPAPMRWEMPKTEPYSSSGGRLEHIIRATFSELSGHTWEHDLRVRDGRRIIAVDGNQVKDKEGKIAIPVKGFKIVAGTPIRRADSIYYKPADRRYVA